APDPLPTLRLMRRDGVLARVLPEAQGFRRLAGLLAVEPEIDPLLRLAALCDLDQAGVLALGARLRLANRERDRLIALAEPEPRLRLGDAPRAQRRALYRLGLERYRDRLVLAAASEGARARPRLARRLRIAARQ